MTVGIERINAYFGKAFIDVRDLFNARELDIRRSDNLMMEQKSCAFPCEDAVTNAVNAAKPIIDQLSDEERNSIDTVELDDAQRVGLFSYGSGCSSEFYSGVIPATAKEQSMVLGMMDKIDDRVPLVTLGNAKNITDLVDIFYQVVNA